MRLWSLHPRYLDPQGLVALWREALLAQAVLQGHTRGYQSHPQLERFVAQLSPVAAIGSYLLAVWSEAESRGYSFDRAKIVAARSHPPIAVTAGQIQYEWQHLMRKLAKWARSKKLDRLYGDVLDTNLPMLALAQSLGFKRVREGDGSGLVRVVLDLNEEP